MSTEADELQRELDKGGVEGRTREGYARLNKELEGDAQKLAMWDELLAVLDVEHPDSSHETVRTCNTCRVIMKARAIK